MHPKLSPRLSQRPLAAPPRPARLGLPAALAPLPLLLLSACGGGGGESPAPAPAPAPIALSLSADEASLPWNKAFVLKPLANDSASKGSLSLAAVGTPSHGTVKIVGNELEYTPVAGYVGPDSFSYTAQAEDGGKASININLKVQAALTLQGLVSDGPIANAQVSASVGGKSFSATADGNGAYRLTVLSDSVSEAIQLSASGAGAQSHVRLSSSLGDLASLARLADKDGVLGASQAAGTTISHYSTALQVLMREANQNQLPTTLAQIKSLSRQVSGERLQDMALAIKLVVDKGAALPAGIADTAALVGQASGAVSAFLNQQASSNSSAYQAALREVSAGEGLGAAAPSFAPSQAFRLVQSVQTLNTSGGFVIDFQPDGKARVLNSQFGESASWVADAEGVTLTLDQPYGRTSVTSELDPGTGQQVQVQLRYEITGLRFRQLTGDLDGGTQALSLRTREKVLSGPQAGQIRKEQWTASGLVKASDAKQLTPLAGGFQVGERIAGVQSIDDGHGADILEFTGADTARLLRSGTQFKWRLSEGRFILSTPVFERSYAELANDDSLGMKYLIAVDTQDGATRRAHEVAAVGVENEAFSDSPWIYSRWQHGFAQDLSFEIGSRGVGNQVQRNPDGSETRFPLSWSLTADGALRLQRGSTVREWKLLQNRQGRMVVLEGVGSTARVSGWRVNVYTSNMAPAGPGSNLLIGSDGESYPLRVNLTLSSTGQLTGGGYDFHKLKGTMTPCTFSGDISCIGASNSFGTATQSGPLNKNGSNADVTLNMAADSYGYSFNGRVQGMVWSGTWTKVATPNSSLTGSGSFSVNLILGP